MSLEMGKVPRELIDLSHLVFSAGKIGCLKVLSTTVVLPGDSIDINAVGSFRLSPLRRGLAVDCNLDIFTFYVPMRHIYGEDWIQFIKDGVHATAFPATDRGHDGQDWATSFLGVYGRGSSNTIPSFYPEAYAQIYNNFFKIPSHSDQTISIPDLSEDECKNGIPCCHLKNIWSAPVPSTFAQEFNLDVSSGSLDIIALQRSYANLHTEQERELFATRYRDIIGDMGGKVNFDADNRPLLLMRTSSWASGYDVDATDSAGLGQFSGRVQQSFQHVVPRYFCPEHGVIMTVCLPRFPPLAGWETDYLSAQPALTYFDVSGDSALMANSAVTKADTEDLFFSNENGDVVIPIATGQWHRYHRSHIDWNYLELDGFPFIRHAPEAGTTYDMSWVNPTDYDDCFQTTQLAHWNIQSRFNQNVYRRLPTARTSLMTSA